MSSPHQPDSESSRVGRARTWWHPIFARVLSWRLQGAYEVRAEVSLGELPLRADYILVQLESGLVSPEALRELRVIVERLKLRTIIELKSPTDALEARDWEGMSACTTLFLRQDPRSFYNHEISRLFIVPKLTTSFSESLKFRDLSLEQEEAGVHRIVGGMFDTWVIETDVIAAEDAQALRIFSHFILTDRQRIMKELTASGHQELLRYVVQQIAQVRGQAGELNMSQEDVEVMTGVEEDVRKWFVSEATVEERLEGLSPQELMNTLTPEERLEGLSPQVIMNTLTPEERLEGLSPQEITKRLTAEERLEGLTPEEMLHSLSPEVRERMKQLLDQEDSN